MTFEIRHYQPHDLSDLLNAWEAAARLAHPFLSEPFFVQERENIPNLYMPNADTWVLVCDGTVVGFVALLGNEVGGLFVDPAFHGQGFGKALVDKAHELHGDLVVEVFKENSIGRRFYDRYGFHALEEKIYEPTGDVLVRMEYRS